MCPAQAVGLATNTACQHRRSNVNVALHQTTKTRTPLHEHAYTIRIGKSPRDNEDTKATVGIPTVAMEGHPGGFRGTKPKHVLSRPHRFTPPPPHDFCAPEGTRIVPQDEAPV